MQRDESVNWLARMVPAVVLAGIYLLIAVTKAKEQSLTAAFPEYRAYASRTPMLIPLTKLPAGAAGGSLRAR